MIHINPELAATILAATATLGIAIGYLPRRWARTASNTILYTVLLVGSLTVAITVFNPALGAIVWAAGLALYLLVRWRIKVANRRLEAITRETREG